MSRLKENNITTMSTSITSQKRMHFAQLATEAKILERQINRLVSSFEKRNKLTCHPITTPKNSIELVIAADISAL